jgi:peptide methionine sulfoxide reductase msrA/msrB
MRKLIAWILIAGGVAMTHPGIADEATSATREGSASTTETAIFASGCFWGTQFMFRETDGVISTRVGYTGVHTQNPSYREVCSGLTGHAEALEIVFDPKRVSYEKLARLFFETHDPTQLNRQGPDIGDQYRSAVFYANDDQKRVAESLIRELRDKGVKAVTEIARASTFWPAEEYHQRYYEKNGKKPYCHSYRKLF